MSKVASAFLHLTETNPQEGLSGPPSLCGGCTLSSPVWVSPGGFSLSSRSRDIQVRWTGDSRFPKFMNGNVYIIVLGHIRKW